MENQDRYFYCYSYLLKEFFIQRGLNPIMASVHMKTNKRFWVFKSGDDVSEALDAWRKQKTTI